MSALRVVQLYPDELGVSGDRGNAQALVVRARLAGLPAEHVPHRPGDGFPDGPGIIVIGNGPVSALRRVHDDLLSLAPRLREFADAGGVVFAFGGGAELLGHGVEVDDGGTLEGLGLLPFRAVRTGERAVGYVKTSRNGLTLVGFEDHASRWTLDEGAEPLGYLEAGKGSQDDAAERPWEGVRAGSLVGTLIGGPVLPLNPQLTDELLSAAASRLGLDYASSDAHATLDHYAREAREVIIKHLDHRFSTIR